MPPRKNAQTDEQKEEAFQKWLGDDEYAAITDFVKAKEKEKDIMKIDNGTEDINADWTDVCQKWFRMMEKTKTPKKSKGYEQAILRTMFFLRKEQIVIDGKTYDISNAAMFDHFKCKEVIMGIWMHTESDKIAELDKGTYQAWRKELVGKLKDWDKHYVKHAKSTNPELALIHSTAMAPLTNLMESTFNYHNFLNWKKEVADLPDFRHKALEERFVEHMTKVCDILHAFPDRHTEKQLADPYDIAQMLLVLKTEGWRECAPLEYYLAPLQAALDATIARLLEMRRLGPLRCHYHLEENRELQEATIACIGRDVTAQWLAGDELKRDQFVFLYQVHELCYRSPLKDEFLKEGDKERTTQGQIFQQVIPQLTVFRAMLNIRDIEDKKKADIEKEEEKKARREALGIPEPEEEEEVLDIPLTDAQQRQKKRGKKIEFDPEVVEEYRRKKAFEKELSTYGRTWIWEKYFNQEDDTYMEKWEQGAEILRTINVQVLEDIQDCIMLRAFQGLSIPEIRKKIQNYLDEKRERQRVLLDEEIKEENDPKILGKDEDRRRKFLYGIVGRPHMKVWNFIQEDDAEVKVPHVMREDAEPHKAYKDGRVENVMELIEFMAVHLRSYMQENWEKLNYYTLAIFEAEEEQLVAEYTERLAALNEGQ